MSQHHYKTREVRDLAWACFSPPLFDSALLSAGKPGIGNCALELTEQRQLWLRGVDETPRALQQHLQKRHNKRLGLYFESLWHFFLQCDAEVDLIAHNLPIRDGGKTLGEFDCLYYCHRRRRYVHLELAVKYYLSHRRNSVNRGRSEWREWLGPGNTDHLDRKINHLFGHQITLGDHPAARSALQALGISSYGREVEIKGYLFQSLSDPLGTPPGYNGQNSLCRWLNVSELPEYLAVTRADSFALLDKTHWLAPAEAQCHDDSLRYSAELRKQLARHFSEFGRPVLIAAFDRSGRESQRFFVTGPNWPGDSGKPGIPSPPL